MATVAPNNQPPVRYPSGLSFDPKYGALAGMAVPSPVWWHQFADDEFVELNVTGQYTKSATTTGTAAMAAGDGGRGLFSTAAANNDAISVQLPAASFILPPATSGKRLYYGCRLQLSDITASSFVAGLVNTNTTPLSGGITDGAYFQKSAGGTILNFITASASALTTTAIPAAAYSGLLVNATDLDFAFCLNPKAEFEVYIGANLFGWQPQSGSGSSVPVRGPCLRLTNAISTAALNVTMGIAAGAAAIKTLNADFHFAAKER